MSRVFITQGRGLFRWRVLVGSVEIHCKNEDEVVDIVRKALEGGSRGQ